MRLIVGLGNPGGRYARTRHNIGVMAVDRVAARWAVTLRMTEAAREGRGRVDSVDVILAQPLAWMNQSGPAVEALLNACRLSPEHLIVVHDDLDLPPGRLRVKHAGGAGGHNGVLSLITVLNTNVLDRLKIGIGRPAAGQETADYVLSPFTPDEMVTMDAALDRAVVALECLVVEGAEAAMNRFNVRDEEESP